MQWWYLPSSIFSSMAKNATVCLWFDLNKLVLSLSSSSATRLKTNYWFAVNTYEYFIAEREQTGSSAIPCCVPPRKAKDCITKIIMPAYFQMGKKKYYVTGKNEMFEHALCTVMIPQHTAAFRLQISARCEDGCNRKGRAGPLTQAQTDPISQAFNKELA